MKNRIFFTLGITLFLLCIVMVIRTQDRLEDGFYTGLAVFTILLIFRGIVNKVEG